LLSFSADKSNIKEDENGLFVTLVFDNISDVEIIDYKIQFEDKKTMQKIVSKRNLDVESQHISVPMGLNLVLPSDTLQDDCNASFYIERVNIQYLFIKVTAIGAYEYSREQHFQLMLFHDKIGFGQQIVI